MKIKGAVPKKIVFYEKHSKTKTWHRYADILIPLITVPTLVYIGICLHDYVMDPNQQKDLSQWKVFVLGSALLLISFGVFCYLCTRLNHPVFSFGKRRIKTNFSLIRSSSSGCFMKSVNSDLQYMVPFNNYPPSYESIIFDVPPNYTIVTGSSNTSIYKSKPCSSNTSALKIVEI